MKNRYLWIGLWFTIGVLPALGQPAIDDSPVLRRWLQNPPNLLEDIERYPSFPSKFRLGISSARNTIGWGVGIEDVFLGNTGFTLSGGYHQTFSGTDSGYYSNLRYYVLPLGSYVNVSPIVGYRQVLDTTGLDVGVQLIVALSPQSADLRLAQTFIAPGNPDEASLTALSASYALGRNTFLHSGVEWRRSPDRSDSRVQVALEWRLPILSR